jgi:GNAT superfamily N-acetyltransferase
LGEAAAVAAVLLESFLEFRPLYTEGGFAATTPGVEQVRVRMKEGPVWVALRDGVMEGTVSSVVDGESVYIRGMAVVPAARGSGAGSRLLQQVETWAAGEGAVRMFLSTTPFLGAAIRLYEGAGFRRTEDGPQELFGTPLFTMAKNISSE